MLIECHTNKGLIFIFYNLLIDELIDSFWITLLSASSVGAIITATFTIIFNKLAKNREEYITMSRYKIDVISKSKPYLNQEALLYGKLSFALNEQRENNDYLLCFYFICNILFIKQKILYEYGDIQFDKTISEEVIADIGDHLIRILSNNVVHMTLFDLENMANFVKFNQSYPAFKREFEDKNNEIFNKFQEGISNLEDTDYRDLKQSCLCFYRLMKFELLYIYKLWYKTEPNSSSIEKEVLDYIKKQSIEHIDLSESYKKYYKHITLSGLSKWEKFEKENQLGRY